MEITLFSRNLQCKVHSYLTVKAKVAGPVGYSAESHATQGLLARASVVMLWFFTIALQ